MNHCGFFVCDCGLPQSDLCPDTDVYERCSMSTGDKGHVKYKIGSVLHRCSFPQIRERVNTVHFACCRSIRLRCVCMCGLAKIVGFVQCLHWRHHGVFEGMVFFLHSWGVCTCFIIVRNLHILVFFLSQCANEFFHRVDKILEVVHQKGSPLSNFFSFFLCTHQVRLHIVVIRAGTYGHKLGTLRLHHYWTRWLQS